MAWCCLLAVLQPSSLLLGLWAAFSLWHQGHRSSISPLNAELGLKAPQEQGLVCSCTLLPTRDGMGWDGAVSLPEMAHSLQKGQGKWQEKLVMEPK